MQYMTIESVTNTDVLGVLLIYPYSLLGAVRPRDRAYISQKPLTTMLQPINIYIYVHAHPHTYT